MKRYENYGRNPSWIEKKIVKWYWKDGGKLWNDMENREESKLNSEKIWKNPQVE